MNRPQTEARAAPAIPPARRPRGRPARFDRARAVEQAMLLFWDRGYEGTSFDALIQAMGISPSSFYNSFTSKEHLYREAVEMFMGVVGAWFAQELAGGPDTKTAFRRLLERAAHEFTAQDHPTGCMVSLAGTHLPPALCGVHEMMAHHRQAARTMMADRIRQGIARGDVPAGTDAEALAGFFDTLARGMTVAARDGATRKALLAIVGLAMRAFPAPPARHGARTTGRRPADTVGKAAK